MEFSSADEDEMVRELERIERRKYFCDLCNSSYSRKSSLIRHKLSHKYYVQCNICKRQYRRVYKRHMKNVHGISKQAFLCNHCSNVYNTYDELFAHVDDNHPLNQQQQHQQPQSSSTSSAGATARSFPPPSSSSSHPENREASVSNALNRAVEVIRLEPQGTEQFDLLAFLANTRSQIRNYLLSRISTQSVKWYLCLQVELERFNVNEDNTMSRPHFRSRTYIYTLKRRYIF